ncbi:hypothetical protein BASA61_003872 [Batrachochytrium salamandrivorans]|nr:hypothetical protein BASA61_003872 [Batrachochytrium salamandrivorans]
MSSGVCICRPVSPMIALLIAISALKVHIASRQSPLTNTAESREKTAHTNTRILRTQDATNQNAVHVTRQHSVLILRSAAQIRVLPEVVCVEFAAAVAALTFLVLFPRIPLVI